jgi:hypothetical protein
MFVSNLTDCSRCEDDLAYICMVSVRYGLKRSISVWERGFMIVFGVALPLGSEAVCSHTT